MEKELYEIYAGNLFEKFNCIFYTLRKSGDYVKAWAALENAIQQTQFTALKSYVLLNTYTPEKDKVDYLVAAWERVSSTYNR